MKQPLRVAIVGCGLIAQLRHIPCLLRMKGTELVAVCDINEELAKNISRRFHVSRYYADFSHMLSREKVDMVDICTPPQTHLPLSLETMKIGCNVLVEKPMALNLKEVDEMANTSKQNQVKLCVVHNKLFEPVMTKAKAMVDEGGIGDLVGIDIKDLLPNDTPTIMNKEHWCHRLPSGMLTEMLPHPIYLATSFLGHVETMAVHTRKVSNYDWLDADEIRIILEGRQGTGVITFSRLLSKDKVIIDIFGTKKNLRIDQWNSVMTEYGVGGESRPSRGLENLS